MHTRIHFRVPVARGFTLIELLITVSVLGILVGVASPSFVGTISNNRAYSAQTEFVSFLALARSEATRRNVPVVVSATAPVTNNEFGAGWSVWVDQNADGVQQSNETVLRTHEALASNVRLSSSTTNAITYAPMGFLNPATAINMKLCSVDAAQGYAIVLQPNGLADVSLTTSQPCP